MTFLRPFPLLCVHCSVYCKAFDWQRHVMVRILYEPVPVHQIHTCHLDSFLIGLCAEGRQVNEEFYCITCVSSTLGPDLKGDLKRTLNDKDVNSDSFLDDFKSDA